MSGCRVLNLVLYPAFACSMGEPTLLAVMDAEATALRAHHLTQEQFAQHLRLAARSRNTQVLSDWLLLVSLDGYTYDTVNPAVLECMAVDDTACLELILTCTHDLIVTQHAEAWVCRACMMDAPCILQFLLDREPRAVAVKLTVQKMQVWSVVCRPAHHRVWMELFRTRVDPDAVSTETIDVIVDGLPDTADGLRDMLMAWRCGLGNDGEQAVLRPHAREREPASPLPLTPVPSGALSPLRLTQLPRSAVPVAQLSPGTGGELCSPLPLTQLPRTASPLPVAHLPHDAVSPFHAPPLEPGAVRPQQPHRSPTSPFEFPPTPRGSAGMSIPVLASLLGLPSEVSHVSETDMDE